MSRASREILFTMLTLSNPPGPVSGIGRCWMSLELHLGVGATHSRPVLSRNKRVHKPPLWPDLITLGLAPEAAVLAPVSPSKQGHFTTRTLVTIVIGAFWAPPIRSPRPSFWTTLTSPPSTIKNCCRGCRGLLSRGADQAPRKSRIAAGTVPPAKANCCTATRPHQPAQRVL